MFSKVMRGYPCAQPGANCLSQYMRTGDACQHAGQGEASLRGFADKPVVPKEDYSASRISLAEPSHGSNRTSTI